MRPRISVVIPGRNDAAALRETLGALDHLAGREAAGSLSPPWVTPRPSGRLWPAASTRAALLNAGAFAACGDILFFLHADFVPPESTFALIEHALSDPDVVGAAFEHCFAEPDWSLRTISAINR